MCVDDPAWEHRRRASARIGWTASLGMVLLLAAGADRPPPPGFLVVLPWAGSVAVLIRRGLPVVLRIWDEGRATAALIRSAGAGLGFGAVSWVVLSLLSPGEPSVDVGLATRAIGLAVVGLLGAAVGLAVAVSGRAFEVRAARHGWGA